MAAQLSAGAGAGPGLAKLAFMFFCLVGQFDMGVGLRMSSGLSEAMSSSISFSTGRPFKGRIEGRGGGWGGGGGGASTGIISDVESKQEFFYKSSGLLGFEMLKGEFESNKAMAATLTIKVPQPVCLGTSDSTAFVVFEKLSLGGSGDPRTYGQQLARLHSCTSPNAFFGFYVNNTIGATFQPNSWRADWSSFWDEMRLGHMLKLAKLDGASFPYEAELRAKVRAILSAHTTVTPSLVHGDLWSGNQGYTTDGTPVIYDPSAYYADAEVDLAMTRLFGSNSNSFYQSYWRERPPQPGWELRQTVYNSYHLLNHFVLFGGGYLQQAENCFARILTS